MFLHSKKNVFTNKHYRIHLDDIEDIGSNQYNTNIHNNEIIPQIINPHICGYCQTLFSSRNKLFYHLGFMGIDIKKSSYDCDRKRKQNKKRRIIRENNDIISITNLVNKSLRI